MAGKATKTDLQRAEEPGRGRDAGSPSEIPAKGWKDILYRLWLSIQDDRILLVAAGATFYLLLALFPALTAFVSIYGFVSDPRTVADHIAFLGGLMPAGGLDIISAQMKSLASKDAPTLGFGFIAGLAVALWSANSGIKALFDGLNVAYREREKRSFIYLNAFSLLFTLGALFIAMAMIFAVGVVPAILAFFSLDGWSEAIIRLSRWPALLVATSIGIATLYRFGPSREPAKWRWLTWGAAFASVVWLAASVGFSYYLENFADYNATYGTLGAVIGFMIWTWISVAIVLLGAELNAELEHQTSVDTTVGPARPLGSRGARMADTVGRKARGE